MDLRPDFMRQASRLQARIDAGTEVSFNDFTFDHLDQKETEIMQNAIKQARSLLQEIEGGSNKSMLLIAQGRDDIRTGYGCGKTMLAKAIYYSNAFMRVVGAEGSVDDVNAIKIARGSFYVAKELINLCHGEQFEPEIAFAEFGNMVVIDDLGREGVLKYVKQDADIQLQEKRDRYYSIIDYCYQTKKSIVITSNMSSGELAEFLGGASWSRLLQMAPSQYRINMSGVRDMRPLLAGE